jgi:hypothetical protein
MAVTKPRVSKVVTPEIKPPPSWADFRRSESQPVQQPAVDWRSKYLRRDAGSLTQYAMRMRSTNAMTQTELERVVPDVKPSVIANALANGMVLSAPGVSERYRGAEARTGFNPRTQNVLLTEAASNATNRGVVGHELVHTWQQKSKNPWTIAAKAGTLAGVLRSQILGKPYMPNYGGLNMEGQASLYHGPSGSTNDWAPQWLRGLALRGFLR